MNLGLEASSFHTLLATFSGLVNWGRPSRSYVGENVTWLDMSPWISLLCSYLTCIGSGLGEILSLRFNGDFKISVAEIECLLKGSELHNSIIDKCEDEADLLKKNMIGMPWEYGEIKRKLSFGRKLRYFKTLSPNCTHAPLFFELFSFYKIFKNLNNDYSNKMYSDCIFIHQSESIADAVVLPMISRKLL